MVFSTSLGCPYRREVRDLEEGLKEKDEVISARTAAAGMTNASLAANNTLDQLEDTTPELELTGTRHLLEAEYKNKEQLE